MWRLLVLVTGCGLLASAELAAQGRGEKPAPPPSRYGYRLAIDAKSLPKGVSVREVRDQLGSRWFITNSSQVPLIIHERFQNEQVVSGSKLVDGQVYQYFPNGVPMEGKTHLKGWQAPFGEIKETLLYMAKEPEKIYAGRQPGLSKDIPPSEPFSLPAKYDGKPHEIRGTIEYFLNEEYDRFHAAKE